MIPSRPRDSARTPFDAVPAVFGHGIGSPVRRRIFGPAWILLWVVLNSSPIERAFGRGTATGALGGVALVAGSLAFGLAGVVLIAGPAGDAPRPRLVLWPYWVGVLATVAALLTVGADGLQLVPYALVVLALGLDWRRSLPIVGTASGLLFLLEHLSHGAVVSRSLAFGALLAGAGSALGRFSAERDKVAKAMTAHAHELEIAEERNRMARDLHDILGHSLTVVAMKAELAEHLVDADPDAARAELREVQSITRSALADVRATVNNYRELSLAGEIARAASTLRSAGVKADLPAVIDEVPVDLRELFAWALREGVTNVVRHSGARLCGVSVTPASILVVDDGSGGARASDGNGLAGLRQRAEGHGARVVTGPSPAGTPDRPGFSLLVTTEGVPQ